ncbi:MAG: hypothetical protein R3E01_31365 [Pirellulaceae bacterium]|nr:hypothetical protein [Planctomycetales bacterium]
MFRRTASGHFAGYSLIGGFFLATAAMASVALTFSVLQAQNETPKGPSEEVKAALSELKIQYEIDEDNDYKVELQTQGNRTQLCYILSESGKWSTLNYREVWSPAHVYEGQLSPELAERVLRDSGQRLIGGWCVTDWGEGRKCLYFTAKVPPNLSAKSLHEVMSVVALVADTLEKEISGETDTY